MYLYNLTIKELPKSIKEKWLKKRLRTTKDIIETKIYRIKNKKNEYNLQGRNRGICKGQ